jgi:hypothetical protein
VYVQWELWEGVLLTALHCEVDCKLITTRAGQAEGRGGYSDHFFNQGHMEIGRLRLPPAYATFCGHDIGSCYCSFPQGWFTIDLGYVVSLKYQLSSQPASPWWWPAGTSCIASAPAGSSSRSRRQRPAPGRCGYRSPIVAGDLAAL